MNGFVIVGIEFEDIAKEDKNGWLKNLFLFVGKVTKKLPNHQIFTHIFFRTMPSHVTIHNKRAARTAPSPCGLLYLEVSLGAFTPQIAQIAQIFLRMLGLLSRFFQKFHRQSPAGF